MKRRPATIEYALVLAIVGVAMMIAINVISGHLQ
jgi:Flp pilus assembly pilin Flp